MKISKTVSNPLACIAIVIATLVLAYAPEGTAADPFPPVSPEGLVLQKDTTLRAVYLKPGFTLAPYRKVAILDCFVEFAPDFQRNYDADQPGLEGQITTSEMNKIKTELAAEFKKVFTQELEANGGFPVVDYAAPDVLLLRPAIINLVVAAPDLMTPDMSTTIVASAGQMTLYLELYDSATSTLIARVIDPEADDDPLATAASSVTNKMAADETLSRWAGILRKHLDAVRAQAAGSVPAAPVVK